MSLAELTGVRFKADEHVNSGYEDQESMFGANNDTQLAWNNRVDQYLTPFRHGVECEGHKIHFLHGTTTLAFKYQGGVIVAADARASMGGYIASSSTEKILPVNRYLMATMAGSAADCQFWVRILRKQCRLFELRNRERISVAAASKLLSNMLYNYKGMGLSIGTMVVGWDKKGPNIYYIDDDGKRLQGNLFSVGSGSTYAYGILDSSIKNDMKDDEAYELARRSIFHAASRDGASGGVINVYHMKQDGWVFIGRYDIGELYYKYKSSS